MKKIPLDATDIRILCAVQRYGNLSKSKLAEMVNLSATPSWIRLNRLKKAGIIRNYYANIAYDDVVDTTKVIVTLSLSNHRKSNFEKFETHIANIDEIIECMATGGGTDYVMKVITPSLTNFQEIMDQLLSAELGIDRYMTYIVTREIKSSQPNLTKLITTK